MITTIVLTVSRDDFLLEVLSALELVECDPTYTNILCIVDGDAKLYAKVRNLIQDTKFNERLTIQYPDRKPIKRFDPVFRRKRISAIHNFAKQQIGIAEFVLLTEDDTVIPRNTLRRLREALNGSRSAVSAEGVEVGRWGIPYVGAWRFDNIYEPTSVTSLAYQETGVEEIDSPGFYCTLMRADVYRNHEFGIFESLGPDISMGLELRRIGYTNFVDWDVKCKHLTMERGQKVILVPDETVKPTTLKRKNEKNWAIVY